MNKVAIAIVIGGVLLAGNGLVDFLSISKASGVAKELFTLAGFTGKAKMHMVLGVMAVIMGLYLGYGWESGAADEAAEEPGQDKMPG